MATAAFDDHKSTKTAEKVGVSTFARPYAEPLVKQH